MTKVHPNIASAAAAAAKAASAREVKGEVVSLTVWRRSLLFNGKGFTVFDCKGNLVYRVETYAGGSPREVVLMDADGHGLVTIRRKVLFCVLLPCFSIFFCRVKKRRLVICCLSHDHRAEAELLQRVAHLRRRQGRVAVVRASAEAVHGTAAREPAPDQDAGASVSGPRFVLPGGRGRRRRHAQVPVRRGGLVRRALPRRVRVLRPRRRAAAARRGSVPEGGRRRAGRVPPGGGARLRPGACHGRRHPARPDARILTRCSWPISFTFFLRKSRFPLQHPVPQRWCMKDPVVI
jgi:hypothetical protein